MGRLRLVGQKWQGWRCKTERTGLRIEDSPVRRGQDSKERRHEFVENIRQQIHEPVRDIKIRCET